MIRAPWSPARPRSRTPTRSGWPEQLARSSRRKVVLERRVDPTLLAGLVTRIGDKVIDGSCAGASTALERRLLRS
jgi:hypothetical protein